MGTIRLKLLKVAARVVVSVRRVVFHLASGYPYQAVFREVYARVRGVGRSSDAGDRLRGEESRWETGPRLGVRGKVRASGRGDGPRAPNTKSGTVSWIPERHQEGG